MCPIFVVKLACGHEEWNSESSFQHSVSKGWESSTIKWQRTADKYVQNNTQALSKSIQFDCLVYDDFQYSLINTVKPRQSQQCREFNELVIYGTSYVGLTLSTSRNTYPNVQLWTMIEFSFKDLWGSIRGTATPCV